MADVRLENVFKVYKNGVKAVKDFNLDIRDKEFIVFVGPSGCGKSTTLRMVAGLEDITSGKIYIDGRLVNDLQPKDRDISMVFQNYALYPHMTVYDNMAYGLRCRKTPKQIIDDKVREAARILGIEEYLERKPKELSGGQRQRVALGRAIVRQPKVFLLDEPLSNLDAKLRVQMRSEITKLHERIGTTFIYVTHDQTEAMTMGTRIVVMKDGIVQQVDSPSNLYEHPANTFVATFLGSPQMNLFDGELLIEGDKTFFLAEDEKGIFKVEIPQNILLQIGEVTHHQKVLLGVRPGDMSVSEKGIITAKIDLLEQLGNETIIYTYLPGREDFTICSMLSKDFQGEAKQTVSLDVDRNRIHLFDKETGESLSKLPEENRIVLPLSQKESKWYLKDTPLVDSFSSTMMYEYAHNDVIISFAPDKVKFEGENEDLKLAVDVHHIAKFSQYYVYYSTLATGERVIFTSSMKKELGKTDIYVSQEDLNYHDKETQEKFASHLLIETNSIEDSTIQKIHGNHYFAVKDPGKGKQRMQKILKTDRLGTKMLILIESIQTGEKRLLLTPWNEDVYMGEIIYLKN